MKQKIRNALLSVSLLVVFNLVVTTMMFRIKNPNLTETCVFFHIPQSFVWNFDK